MGKQALTSHMKGKKHVAALNSIALTSSVKTFFSASDKVSKNIVSTEPSTSHVKNVFPEKTAAGSDCDLVSEENIVEKGKSQCIKPFLLSENVTKAEILWCLKTVMEHIPFRSSARLLSVIKLMLPDSKISEKIKLERTKVAYTLVHGLAPLFSSDLVTTLQSCSHIAVGFDESLNKVSQRQQMDIVVRFWDTAKDEVASRYLNSVFLGHTCSSDILQAFKNGLLNVDLKKIVQISMDGPYVNFKFLRDLQKEMKTSPEEPVLLDLGSCGLHTLHCAFKAGIQATGWNVVEFLRAIYNLFKDVPARRADYMRYTGSSVFPRKFCAIRWIENAAVACRAIEILPDLKKYVSCTKAEKKMPKCKSYNVVDECTSDELIGVKLAFFQTFAEAIEPFLKEFQGDAPLAPFLYQSLSFLTQSIMARFVKDEVVEKHSLNKIDFNNQENLKTPRNVDIGYAARKELKKLKKVSERELLALQHECRIALQKFVIKTLERSPLKFGLTRAISFLDPFVFAEEKVSSKRLKLCLEILVSSNWLSGCAADRIDQEFKVFRKNREVMQAMANYDRKTSRLDHHWMTILKLCKCSDEMLKFVKLPLILSHGNASLERGFSVNKDCLIENQSELSLVALRQIYDTVQAAGGVLNFEVTKKMIHAARNAHSVYTEVLKQQLKNEKNKEREENDCKRKVEELKHLHAKKFKLMADANEKLALIDQQISDLKN